MQTPHKSRISLLCALLLGCPADEESTPSEVVHAGSEAHCAALFSCECVEYGYPDVQHCVDALDAEISGYLAGGEQAGLTFDADCLREDFDLGPEPCELDIYAPWDPESEQCNYCNYFHGTVSLGEPCVLYGDFDDCARGSSCEDGVCIDPCERPGVGDPCYQSWEGCDEGLVCDWDTELCVSALAEGAPCAEGPGCAEGLGCSFDSGVCEVLPTLGEPCPDFACAEGFCLGGLCSPPSATGGPCESDTHCEYPLRCQISSDYEGTCGPPTPVGAACTDWSECESQECEDGVCVALEPWICGG